MRYSLIATFLLAAVATPAWCDSSHEAMYDADSAPIANQIPDSHQSYDRKSYYQQNDPQHYPMQQEHSPPNYHQYKPPAHPQLKEEEPPLPNPPPFRKEPEEENEGGEKEDRGAGYNPQMRQNNFVPYFNRQNMMNGGQNYRQGPQFIPPKFTMEQQMQMQIMQRQRMLAAAQAQAFMNQQQHFPQPPAQHYSQPPAQHYSQPPAQHYSQPPAQHYSQPSAQHYAQPPVHQYQPPAPVAPQPSPQMENYSVSRPPMVKPRYQPPTPPPPPAPKIRYAPPQQAYYEDYENPRQKE